MECEERRFERGIAEETQRAFEVLGRLMPVSVGEREQLVKKKRGYKGIVRFDPNMERVRMSWWLMAGKGESRQAQSGRGSQESGQKKEEEEEEIQETTTAFGEFGPEPGSQERSQGQN